MEIIRPLPYETQHGPTFNSCVNSLSEMIVMELDFYTVVAIQRSNRQCECCFVGIVLIIMSAEVQVVDRTRTFLITRTRWGNRSDTHLKGQTEVWLQVYRSQIGLLPCPSRVGKRVEIPNCVIREPRLYQVTSSSLLVCFVSWILKLPLHGDSEVKLLKRSFNVSLEPRRCFKDDKLRFLTVYGAFLLKALYPTCLTHLHTSTSFYG